MLEIQGIAGNRHTDPTSSPNQRQFLFGKKRNAAQKRANRGHVEVGFSSSLAVLASDVRDLREGYPDIFPFRHDIGNKDKEPDTGTDSGPRLGLSKRTLVIVALPIKNIYLVRILPCIFGRLRNVSGH